MAYIFYTTVLLFLISQNNTSNYFYMTKTNSPTLSYPWLYVLIPI